MKSVVGEKGDNAGRAQAGGAFKYLNKYVGRALPAFCIALFSLLTACGSVNDVKREASFFDYFDTVITITAYGAGAEEFEYAVAQVKAELERYHALFDIYNEYAGINNLATVNRLAGKPVKVDSAVIELVEYGIWAHELTGGAVNIAMGGVLKLWRNARVNTHELPEDTLLSEAALHCDISCIVVDAGESSVMLSDSEMSLDVGAIAKGYVCDKLAELLEEHEGSYLLNCGGTVRAVRLKPDGSDWVAGIVNPVDAAADYAARVTVTGAALATSGAYIRRFNINGVEYGHIIDPVTSYPAAGFASVSALCRDAALADVLSTACFILTLEEGTRLIESLDGAEALYILNDCSVIRTSGFPE